MKTKSARGAQLACLFLLGCLLFNYPLLALFNLRATILGIPAVYAYLFAAWLLLVVLAAAIMERRD